MRPGRPFDANTVLDSLGASVLAERRVEGEAPVTLGPRETKLLGDMPWPLRRAEWLAGRKVAKRLLEVAFGLPPSRVEVLPRDSGAPLVHVDGAPREGLVLNISHTRGWAVAAAAEGPVGVDVCDDIDGVRIARIAKRVFSEGEAEACGAFSSLEHQSSVWAIKEAGLKLRIGGVFDPGARSIRVECVFPARVADETMRVELLRLPDAAVAVARNSTPP